MGEARRRHWFQFGIGTMLLLTTVFAIGLAWELKFIRERKAALDRIDRSGGSVLSLANLQQQIADNPGVAVHRSLKLPSVPLWRRWLGDEPICTVVCVTDADRDVMTLLFPEAVVQCNQ